MQETNTQNIPLNFNYFMPVNLVFGSGKVEKVGILAKPYGKKALIVLGGSSAKKSGLYEKIKGKLEESQIETVLFDHVPQNPLTTTMEEGVRVVKENGCDFIVAVGGGSVLDCGKAIAFMSVNEGDVSDYIFSVKTSEKSLPLIAIPTTCGTGSEGNGFAVLTNPETGDKKSIRNTACIPKVSIVDPECMMTMPKSILATVGFDALCHCMEAYISTIGQPISDALALQGMTLLANHLVKVYEDPTDKIAYEKVSMASTLGGMVIHMAGVTLAHGMEHPASGLKNIVHGKGLAALTPVIVEASYQGNPEKFTTISRLFGGNSGEDCGIQLRKLLKQLELTCNLSDLGMNATDIPWMVENCFKVSAAAITNHPIVFGAEDLTKLYQTAMSES